MSVAKPEGNANESNELIESFYRSVRSLLDKWHVMQMDYVSVIELSWYGRIDFFLFLVSFSC